MSLFKFKKPTSAPASTPIQAPISTPTRASAPAQAPNSLAEMVLGLIHDGVVMTEGSGVICYINPAAATMLGLSQPSAAVGLDYGLVIRLESADGQSLSEDDNLLIRSIRAGQPLEAYVCNVIVGQTDKRVPVSLSAFPSGSGGYVITFRNIAKELADDSEKADFVSTASHEMRTPVASIEGYLSLALNPQTATIDERARGYLDAAHTAAKHLGKLFQDLLDVTKLDDGRVRPHPVPAEMTGLVGEIVSSFQPQASQAGVRLVFINSHSTDADSRRLEQLLYGYVDPDFMREILGNLIDNALKYTSAGGTVSVNVRGEGDRIVVSVRDNGMGIAASDLAHIFQKFYRADNSDTRTIGGTGLGLYIVKQRVEAMGGRVWAESVFGEGSSFYVSLPRISAAEYEKRMISVYNNINGGNK